MITDLVISVIAGLVLGLVNLLPKVEIDLDAFAHSTGLMGQLGGAMNGYAPTTQFAIALGLLVTLKVGLSAWNGILFIYHQFWGS